MDIIIDKSYQNSSLKKYNYFNYLVNIKSK